MLVCVIGQVYGELGRRRVFVADSFKGIPKPNLEKYPADAPHAKAYLLMKDESNTALSVMASFKKFQLIDDRDSVRFLEGYFNETLPAARSLFTQFAVIRLDGDTYESTINALENLYPLLSPGGFVIVDDYMDWEGCRRATLDFREKNGVDQKGDEPLLAIYHDLAAGEIPRGVWWQKSHTR